jgi:hypothetical protein
MTGVHENGDAKFNAPLDYGKLHGLIDPVLIVELDPAHAAIDYTPGDFVLGMPYVARIHEALPEDSIGESLHAAKDVVIGLADLLWRRIGSGYGMRATGLVDPHSLHACHDVVYRWPASAYLRAVVVAVDAHTPSPYA